MAHYHKVYHLVGQRHGSPSQSSPPCGTEALHTITKSTILWDRDMAHHHKVYHLVGQRHGSPSQSSPPCGTETWLTITKSTTLWDRNTTQSTVPWMNETHHKVRHHMRQRHRKTTQVYHHVQSGTEILQNITKSTTGWDRHCKTSQRPQRPPHCWAETQHRAHDYVGQEHISKTHLVGQRHCETSQSSPLRSTEHITKSIATWDRQYTPSQSSSPSACVTLEWLWASSQILKMVKVWGCGSFPR